MRYRQKRVGQGQQQAQAPSVEGPATAEVGPGAMHAPSEAGASLDAETPILDALGGGLGNPAMSEPPPNGSDLFDDDRFGCGGGPRAASASGDEGLFPDLLSEDCDAFAVSPPPEEELSTSEAFDPLESDQCDGRYAASTGPTIGEYFFDHHAAEALVLPVMLARGFEHVKRRARSHSTRVKAKLLEELSDIPNQDIIYEQLAKGLAYGGGDAHQLRCWGYSMPEVVVPHDPLTGMYAVAVHPAGNLPGEVREAIEEMHGAELRSVIAFRGSADAVDWADDLSPEFVGAFQFNAHRGQISDAIAACDSPPDTTGHSLGGAIAQLAATVGSVGRVVTFQSPGIPASMLDEIDDDVEATHHRAANDPVAWAGEAHIGGDVLVHHTTHDSLLHVDQHNISHTHVLLGGLNELRGGAVPEVFSEDVYRERTPRPGQDPDLIGHSTDPNTGLVVPDLPGIDDAKVDAYFDKMERGGTSRLIDVKRGRSDEESGGIGGVGGLYDRHRRGVAEGARSGLGGLARMGDASAEHWFGESAPGATEVLANLANQATGGRDTKLSGKNMKRYLDEMERWEAELERRQQAQGAAFDVKGLVGEMMGERVLPPALADKLKAHLEWKASR
ncbi:MAG: hypothetical protein EA397_17930 [Deltaproteobacteria bacterium]|nr:MAG: hypothetical protein EA397_17930 [Deltaproteobacteria bacterium]